MDKIEKSYYKCGGCWHFRKATGNCRLEPLPVDTEVGRGCGRWRDKNTPYHTLSHILNADMNRQEEKAYTKEYLAQIDAKRTAEAESQKAKR